VQVNVVEATQTMSGIPDWDLVARARTGDMESFARLVRRYEGPLIHFCYRMVGSHQDAQDLAQESFIRVYRYLDRLKPEAKFSTALFGMARNLTLNFLRDTGRRGRGKHRSLTEADDAMRDMADDSSRPDRAARLHEIEGLIERALELLSPEHKEVLILREIQGLDYDAIAAIVRCRRGTVKSRLARAREQLRARLSELGGELL
ncbi:MAG: sigma-70 family RNA polymerase sigma factor, partial [Candidatus Hydrogenedentes bacterium]|nr:sigma-70 family RNA polymerase sigma factor [Candidatus Hydrogenedentota bacterium]